MRRASQSVAPAYGSKAFKVALVAGPAAASPTHTRDVAGCHSRRPLPVPVVRASPRRLCLSPRLCSKASPWPTRRRRRRERVSVRRT